MTMLKVLDLFAGCGGLSLGLEKAGLEPSVAVEKSPMAAETHFRNFHKRGFEWDQRVWEDLLESGKNGTFAKQLDHGTVVSDVWDLLEDQESMDALFDLSPEVIVGGPPCQGFSMAGRRNPEDERNQLPWAFLRFVERLAPKAVVIENVAGINMAFSSRGGVEPPFRQLHAALEKTGIGYVVQPVELNARHFGVPQSRSRMMLIGMRCDLSGVNQLSVSDEPWRSQDAFEEASAKRDPTLGLDLVPEIGSRVDRLRAGHHQLIEYCVEDALRDIDDFGYRDTTDYRKNGYRYARAMRGPRRSNAKLKNHVLRKHSEKVTERFDLYHFLHDEGIDTSILSIPGTCESEAKARELLSESLGDFSESTLPDNRLFIKENDRNLVDVVMRLHTRKHTQHVINGDEPAPTVVTLPDDYVHYRKNRIPTVRELARFQSFPDWFEFRSKETTGSHRRRTEVPQYTQVGNAVPPLMAQAIGELLNKVLNRS